MWVKALQQLSIQLHLFPIPLLWLVSLGLDKVSSQCWWRSWTQCRSSIRGQVCSESSGTYTDALSLDIITDGWNYQLNRDQYVSMPVRCTIIMKKWLTFFYWNSSSFDRYGGALKPRSTVMQDPDVPHHLWCHTGKDGSRRRSMWWSL